MENVLNNQLEEMNAPLIDYGVCDTEEHMGKKIELVNTYKVNQFDEMVYMMLIDGCFIGEVTYSDIFNELNHRGYLEL